jgi:hypothetical protein
VKRLVPLLALALAVTLPLGAAARPRHTPSPAATAGAASSSAGSASDVSCAGGDPVVWVNTETKVYHLSGSSYYGKTKHGKYACASDATKMGAHAAKREGGPSRADATSTAPTAAPDASSGNHRKHKRGRTPLSPAASPTPM